MLSFKHSFHCKHIKCKEIDHEMLHLKTMHFVAEKGGGEKKISTMGYFEAAERRSR